MDIHTGARQGELLALRWDDIDLEAGTLTIRGTLRQGSTEVGPTKTKVSTRTLGLSETTAWALDRARAAQARQRLAAGSKWQDFGGFVFTTASGRPLDATNVTKQLQRDLKRLGLPKVRFHDVRHSYATFALEAGEDLATISKSLGHSNITTTADLYMHWTKSAAKSTASAVERHLSA